MKRRVNARLCPSYIYMNKFTANTINDSQQYIAAKLIKGRQALGLKPKDAAAKLKINYKYIEALEKGDFSNLPEGLYGRNFLKEYALFLGLNADKLAEIYEQEQASGLSETKADPFSRKKPRLLFFISVPKIIRNIIILFVILICLAYLAYYLNNIISPPKLAIFYPPANITVEKNIITIQGQTEPEAKLLINGEVVLTDADGFFTRDINLKKGINNIQISAQKKYSRQNIITKKIIWEINNK